MFFIGGPQRIGPRADRLAHAEHVPLRSDAFLFELPGRCIVSNAMTLPAADAIRRADRNDGGHDHRDGVHAETAVRNETAPR